MKDVNHIFLCRSNIDIRNDNINQRLEAALVAAFKHKLSLDENGQAVINKTRPLMCPKAKRRPDEEIVEEIGSDVQSPRKKEKNLQQVVPLRTQQMNEISPTLRTMDNLATLILDRLIPNLPTISAHEANLLSIQVKGAATGCRR